jgi:hypothetical protein
LATFSSGFAVEIAVQFVLTLKLNHLDRKIKFGGKDSFSFAPFLTFPTVKINNTMKIIIAASLIAGAAAFAPAQQSARTSVATDMAFENELGAQQPLGFFDPLGLVADGDQAKFDRLRYVEIKHGRVSMLAVAGYLIQEAGVRLPGDIDYSGTSFADIPNGFGAFAAIPTGGLVQLFIFIGLLETSVMKDLTGSSEFVGDFRNNYIDFGWDTFDEETKLKKRAIELNQGRAAQMGILALMVHEQLGVSLIPGQGVF